MTDLNLKKSHNCLLEIWVLDKQIPKDKNVKVLLENVCIVLLIDENEYKNVFLGMFLARF